jgi:hypothetical protein
MIRLIGLWRPAAIVAAIVVPGVRVTCPAADDSVVEEARLGTVPAQENQHLIDLGANFDANLFEQQGNGWVLRGGNGLQVQGRLVINGRVVVGGGGREASPTESPTFTRARSLAEKRLSRIDDAVGLMPEQRQRLQVAIESDIRRFASEIDEVRSRFAEVRVNLNDQEGQKTWHRFQQEVQRCRQRLRGLFDDGSLFAKVLPATLEPGQLAAIEAEARARRSFRWRAMVAATLVKMDEAIGLDEQQHELIEQTLLAREPALRVDELSPDQDNAHLQQNLVYMVLASADQAALKKAVSERQWRTLALLMNQGKAMRSWIEQQGILEGTPQ